ncbi:hypothetical protein CN345_23615 [Bacillus thuringiensis]|uniref:hypothetical protein n=1 Tax=Bacillus thuringiensis TaxID=1428 RepID=UPI000BF3EBC3|nr:hypothetical protein [Bacillus thuringiensis]PEZ27229.1 hypothetical protein CN345_23615 [Bacillus thuringiensis]PGY42877.1 hypothetical protein COE09_25065 [Bacillus thuringiensis]
MNPKDKRIRILDLQDQHCQICEYQMKPLQVCLQQHCEIGQELKDLAHVLVTEGKEQKSMASWDAICKQATQLAQQGFGATYISKKLGCSRTTLREQLKKRGLWSGQTQKEIQERSRQSWDHWCEEAKQYRVKGWSYPKIAHHLQLPASNLREQMYKRGFDTK